MSCRCYTSPAFVLPSAASSTHISFFYSFTLTFPPLLNREITVVAFYFNHKVFSKKSVRVGSDNLFDSNVLFTSVKKIKYFSIVVSTMQSCRISEDSHRVYDASADVKGFHLNSPRNRGSLDKRPSSTPDGYSLSCNCPVDLNLGNRRTDGPDGIPRRWRRIAPQHINFPLLRRDPLLHRTVFPFFLVHVCGRAFFRQRIEYAWATDNNKTSKEVDALKILLDVKK